MPVCFDEKDPRKSIPPMPLKLDPLVSILLGVIGIVGFAANSITKKKGNKK